jgi:hypothetical protein
VFRAIAALALASAASTHSSATLVSNAPWWEKVTVTIAGDGKPQSCRYESSLQPNNSQQCDVVGSQAEMTKSAGSKEEYTRITFERRFDPGAQSREADLQPGDQLLGRQVLALAIDHAGAVENCRILAASGDMRPEYGCDEASAEKFEANAGPAKAPPREGVMTILVYGHSEHVV